MRRLLLPGIVATALAVTPAPSHGDARLRGFNDNSTIAGDLRPARDAALLARMGANSARITVNWRYLEPRRGALSLKMYDPVYRAWTRRGIRPLLVLMGAPKWTWNPWVFCARNAPCHFPPDRTRDADWARFVGEVARQYPQAAGIEVWNEPNLRGFWASGVDPGRYTELLRIARTAVKRVDPEMPVIGASLAPVLTEQADGEAHGVRPFLDAMYAAGARGLMDGLAIHPYPQGRPQQLSWDMITTALDVRDAAGDTAPLWLTEVGASTTGGYTPVAQAAVLGDLLPRLMRHPAVEAVYVHTLIEPRRERGPERGYGLFRPDGSPKPAACNVARAFGAVTGCIPAPVPPQLKLRWDAQERSVASAP